MGESDVTGTTGNYYRNDGGLTFTDIGTRGVTPLKYADMDAADIDGDGDTDLASAGGTGDGQTMLAANDGSGLFTEMVFLADSAGGVFFHDIDGDGDPDLLTSGSLYINDGSGTFTDNLDNPFESTAEITNSFHHAGFSDVDGDGDIDLFRVGSSYQSGGGMGGPVTFLYLNNGDSTFTDSGIAFPATSDAGGFFSADGDGSPDVFHFGYDAFSDDYIEDIYINDGAGNFTKRDSNFIQVSGACAEAGDVDRDGDEDLLVAGRDAADTEHTVLYLNDGSGLFLQADCGLTGVYAGTIDIADLDNDGDDDLLVTGDTDSGAVIILYENLIN